MRQASLKEIVKDIRGLEPLPAVMTRVLEIGSRDEVVPDDLIDVMRTDLGITCKALKVCNSPFYGLRREIASLREAGNVLGVKALVNLVVTCGANDYFHKQGGGEAEALWRRCLTYAIASKLVAERHGKTDPELAYTAGLLQDVGHLVLASYYSEARVFIDAEVKDGTTRVDAERDVLGMSHAEAGARLLSRWDMPRTLVDAVRHHHDPRGSEVDAVLAATIHLAETVAAKPLFDGDTDGPNYAVNPAALELTGLVLDDFGAVEESLRGELERADEMLVA